MEKYRFPRVQQRKAPFSTLSCPRFPGRLRFPRSAVLAFKTEKALSYSGNGNGIFSTFFSPLRGRIIFRCLVVSRSCGMNEICTFSASLSALTRFRRECGDRDQVRIMDRLVLRTKITEFVVLLQLNNFEW